MHASSSPAMLESRQISSSVNVNRDKLNYIYSEPLSPSVKNFEESLEIINQPSELLSSHHALRSLESSFSNAAGLKEGNTLESKQIHSVDPSSGLSVSKKKAQKRSVEEDFHTIKEENVQECLDDCLQEKGGIKDKNSIYLIPADSAVDLQEEQNSYSSKPRTETSVRIDNESSRADEIVQNRFLG